MTSRLARSLLIERNLQVHIHGFEAALHKSHHPCQSVYHGNGETRQKIYPTQMAARCILAGLKVNRHYDGKESESGYVASHQWKFLIEAFTPELGHRRVALQKTSGLAYEPVDQLIMMGKVMIQLPCKVVQWFTQVVEIAP